tara:strand:+ start:1015 stop:2037 length:1023 start_codon:yes stop_codon:yes gene_type:complete
MSISIDIIICTYNREVKVNSLIDDIISKKRLLNYNDLIVVDSSENINCYLQKNNSLKYLRSSQKNQLYQRFLGVSFSKSNFVFFLDDDMEIIDEMILSKSKDFIMNNNEISAIGYRFIEKNENASLNNIPTSSFNFLNKFKNLLTGYPSPSAGKLGWCGVRGKVEDFEKNPPFLSEYISGGAFLAKREKLFENFNFQLMDIFNDRLGMGEDTILGYGLSKSGKVFLWNEISFFHNDQNNSVYASNIFNYSLKVLFSRLYLSLEKNRIDCKNLFLPKLHYHYYSFFRLFGYLLNYFLNPCEERLLLLKGSFKGYFMSFSLFFKYQSKNEKWEEIVSKDLNL